eukprot:3567051-Prorocentrum_lima.AAC.1
MEKRAALNGHPCVMPLGLVNVFVSPLRVVHLLVVAMVYHIITVWYRDGACRLVLFMSVLRGIP